MNASSVVSLSLNRRTSADRRHTERRSGTERRQFDFDYEAGLMLSLLGFAHTPAVDFFPYKYSHPAIGVVRAWPMGDRLIVRLDEPERAPEGVNVDPHTGRINMRRHGDGMEAIDAMRARLELLLA